MSALDDLHRAFPGSDFGPDVPPARHVRGAAGEFIAVWAQSADGSPGHAPFDAAIDALASLVFAVGQEAGATKFDALCSALKKVLPNDVKVALVLAFSDAGDPAPRG